MTPAEAVAQICARVERPDLVGMNTLAEAALFQALYKVHGIAKFSRDKTFEDTPIVPAQSYLIINRPARFRKLAKVQSVDSLGNIVVDEFKNRRLQKQLHNYFGYVEQNTYQEVGATIRVDFGSTYLSETVSDIRLHYYAFPTWTVVDGARVTDSWILDEYPFPVIAEACSLLSTDTDDDTAFQKYRNENTMYERNMLLQFPYDPEPE